MELYPAVDLLGGRCVRLVRGDFAATSSYGDPVDAAMSLVGAGARNLHVVDLDAARTASTLNRAVVERIASSSGVPVQVGGGIRTLEAADGMLEAGAARVVVGTAALESPELVREMALARPGRIVVGLDHRAGELAARGWTARSGRGLLEVLERLEGDGVVAVVVTDIERDGTLSGPDFDGLRRVLERTSLEVVASGGVSSAADVAALARLSAGGRHLAGVIVGKAIHEGVLKVEEALAACAASG